MDTFKIKHKFYHKSILKLLPKFNTTYDNFFPNFNVGTNYL